MRVYTLYKENVRRFKLETEKDGENTKMQTERERNYLEN